MVFFLAIAVFGGLLAAVAGLLLLAERYLADYGLCKVEVNEGTAFDIRGGVSLLNALYENKIFIPSACGGKGTCGHCKVQVLSGAGAVLPTELPYLTRREIRNHVRLACQVKVKGDIRLRVPEEYLRIQQFRARVVSTRSVTYDIKEVRLALIEPPRIEFRPGQYVQVLAPSPNGGEYRAYSISSPTHEKEHVELIVRLVPGGIGSTYIHRLREGEEVLFTGPYGEFRLSEEADRELVCVGGGCGMAPIKCIIHHTLTRWPQRSVWFFFGCRAARDIFYLKEFKLLEKEHPNFHCIYALSEMQPGDEWDGEVGFIHLAVEKMLLPGVKRQAYLCGPPPMIEAVTRVLIEKGMSPEEIFYDKF